MDWEELKKRIKPGEIRKGKVVEIKHFGAFVDLGLKFKGLVLIPHVSLPPIQRIEDYLTIDMVYNFQVLDLALNTPIEWSYISLSLIGINQKE